MILLNRNVAIIIFIKMVLLLDQKLLDRILITMFLNKLCYDIMKPFIDDIFIAFRDNILTRVITTLHKF